MNANTPTTSSTRAPLNAFGHGHAGRPAIDHTKGVAGYFSAIMEGSSQARTLAAILLFRNDNFRYHALFTKLPAMPISGPPP